MTKNGKKAVRFLLHHTKDLLPVVTGSLVFCADQLMKGSVELKQNGELWGNETVELKKAHNDGFVLGAAKDHPELVKTVPAVAIGAAAAAYAAKGKKTAVGNAGEGLLLGGAASNLYDRYRRGYVVDYVHVKKTPLQKIIFNIGDAAIALGALLSNF